MNLQVDRCCWSRDVFFFFQAEDGIRDWSVTGVQTCALPISRYDDGGARPALRFPRRYGSARGSRRGAAASLTATTEPCHAWRSALTVPAVQSNVDGSAQNARGPWFPGASAQ